MNDDDEEMKAAPELGSESVGDNEQKYANDDDEEEEKKSEQVDPFSASEDLDIVMPSKRRRVGRGRGRAPKAARMPRVKAVKAPVTKHIVFKGPTMPAVQSNINTVDPTTRISLLHTACRIGHSATVEALLRAGAYVYAVDKEKRSPLVTACQQGHTDVVRAIHSYLRTQHPDDDKEYAAAMKKTFLAVDRLGRMPIVHAVKNGHFRLTKALIKEFGVPMYGLDTSDNSLVMYAAGYGWNSILRLLLVLVADNPEGHAGTLANKTNIWKLGPLFISVTKSHMRCAATLLEMPNVDVNARDSDGNTILHHVIKIKPRALEQCLAQLQFFIVERKADTSLREPKEQRNLLHILCAFPYDHLVVFDPNAAQVAKDAQRKSTEADLKIAAMLLDSGVPLDATDGSSKTPLMIALEQRNYPLLGFLLERGARTNVSFPASQLTPAMMIINLVRSTTSKETAYFTQAAREEQERQNRARYGGSAPYGGFGWGGGGAFGSPYSHQHSAPATSAKEKWTDEQLAAKSAHEAFVAEMDAQFFKEKMHWLARILECGAKNRSSEMDPIDPQAAARATAEPQVVVPSEEKAEDSE